MLRVAAIQATPIFIDRAATTDKACDLIATAGQQGARLAVMPETFIPAYPCWVWKVAAGESGAMTELYGELLDQSVEVPSSITDKLGRAAKQAKVNIVIGISERSGEGSRFTMYNSVLHISETGEFLACRRKLVPTAGERLVWGRGDGSTLLPVEFPFGRVGTLICWENYMPLARYAMYAAGIQIYCAPAWDRGEMWLNTLRHIAKESGLYVIGCGMALRKRDIPDRFAFKERYTTEWVNAGGSMIVGPDGKILAGPVHECEEILFAEIDLAKQPGEHWELDVAGHYSRPDIFTFAVNRAPQRVME